ncbi:MAG: DUF6364 family protein [Candidatus Margulisbacteria bacterium]|jgi:hypothetical protein|nr:DUF6364 family protein [Candidatus Margulisiibacteriota bacterium]
MYTKLTLNVEKAVVENARIYAKQKQRSISKLVEEYLASISADTKDEENIKLEPLTKRIAGIISVDKNFNYKEILTEALMEKHL